MKYMNDSDIQMAAQRHGNHPVLGRAIEFLIMLKHETDMHSDGWAYWPKPVRAAKNLMTLIESGDATEDQYRAALRPIKSFYTRFGYNAGMQFPAVQ